MPAHLFYPSFLNGGGFTRKHVAIGGVGKTSFLKKAQLQERNPLVVCHGAPSFGLHGGRETNRFKPAIILPGIQVKIGLHARCMQFSIFSPLQAFIGHRVSFTKGENM